MKKTRIIVLLVLVVAGIASYLYRVQIVDAWKDFTEKDVPAVSYSEIRNTNSTNNANEGTNENTNQNSNSTTSVVQELPDEYNLAVPFTTQAPFANWDYPYQEACEEASALTVHYYYSGKTFTQELADKEILDLVAWENGYFGDYKDTTAEQTAEFIEKYFGYSRVDVEYDPSIEQIKQHVYAGHPVIVPAAGKLLGNPNFRNGGPLYHMFVIRGFTKTQFITNDVGTRRGENYRYDLAVVMDAMHDWNGGDVENGQKVIIVVYPND